MVVAERVATNLSSREQGWLDSGGLVGGDEPGEFGVDAGLGGWGEVVGCGECDDARGGAGGGEQGGAKGGVVTKLPEGAARAGAVLGGEAVYEIGRDGVEEDVEDAVFDAERAFADVVEEGGGQQLLGGGGAFGGGDALEVLHGENGVASVAGALGEKEL